MTCCFIGHRKVENKEEILPVLAAKVEELIINENADTFLFGSKSRFDDLCWEAVTDLQERYKHIKRIYVRAEYQYINTSYENYLLESYESTYFPAGVENAGKLAYVKRNQIMIDESDICIFYYKEDYLPPAKQRKYLLPVQKNSGTRLALDYAKKKKKAIIMINNSI